MSKHIKTTQNYTISFTTTGKKEKQPIKYCHILENSIYLYFFQVSINHWYYQKKILFNKFKELFNVD